jgi:uncharacterized protein YmfQ (DUF2313 family)
MGRTYEDYRKLLQSLLPKGKFWTRAESSCFTELLNGAGDELSRVEQRAEDLIEEAFPTRIQETFEEWEADFDIPDEGKELESTDAGRRQVIHAKFVATGQQNKEYFYDIATALGYSITIEGIQKSLVGIMTIGDSVITEDDSVFYWFINIDVSDVMMSNYTKANISQLMIDIFKRIPAHTIPLFRFTGIEFDSAFSHDFDSIPWYDGSWWPLEFTSEFSIDFANNSYYDGIRLTGGYSNAFDLSFDSYRGGDFSKDEFSTDFLMPS